MNKKILLWVLSLVLLCSFASATLADDTVSYYKADVSASFPDAVGINNGTINGATFNSGEGIVNSAYSFDDTNDYIALNENFHSSDTDFTINTWVNRATGASGAETIYGSYQNTPDYTFVSLAHQSADTVRLSLRSEDTSTLNLESTTDVADNSWHMITIGRSGTNVYLYVDGTLEDSGTITGSLIQDYEQYLGGLTINGAVPSQDWYGGKIDEFSFFDTKLTQSNIDFLYNSGSPTEEQQYPYTGSSSSNFTITANINNFSAIIEAPIEKSSEYACTPYTCFNYTIPFDQYNNTKLELGSNLYSFDATECTESNVIEIKKDTDFVGPNAYYYCNNTLIQTVLKTDTVGSLYVDIYFNTTTGTITTSILNNDTNLYNVNLFADEYYNVTFYDYNVSSDLNYNFPYFYVSAVDNGTGLNITNFDVLVEGIQTYNVTNGLVPIYINQSTVNISVYSNGYLTYSDTAHNTSNNLEAQMYNYSVNITFLDSNTSLGYSNSDITVFYPSGYSEILTTNENGTIFFDAFHNGLNEVGSYTFQVNENEGYITPINFTATINQTNFPYNNTYEVDRAFINITIRDVQTDAILTVQAIVTLGGVAQYNTTTGNLIIRDSNITSGSYTLTTYIEGYDLNIRNFDYTALEEKSITIYMINTTAENTVDWIITVLDPFYNEFLGADTRLLQYDPVNDVFEEIDSCITNSIGRCVYTVEVGVKKYIVTASGSIDGVDYYGKTSELGEVIYFDQDAVSIFLNIQSDFYVSPDLNLDIWPYNDTLVNSTGGTENANISYLSAEFLDSEGNTHEVCLDYYYVDGLNKELATTICATGSSGIVKVLGGYILDRSYTWIVDITLVKSGGDKEVVYSFTYQKEDGAESQLGIYAKFVIVLAFILMLVISLWMKNILIFGIGSIAVQPFIISILPSYWDWKITSVIILLSLVLIYLTRKTESLQSV